MTWFKVDDGFWSHPKTFGLSDAAVALWVRAGSYCGKHLTDGYVDARFLTLLQGSVTAAEELVDAGLWTVVDGGYSFHDWKDCQDSREAVERRREAWKGRQQRYREKVEAAQGESNDSTPSSYNHSIPFHSRATRESRRDMTRESRRDIRTPNPPHSRTPAEVMAELEAIVAKDEAS